MVEPLRVGVVVPAGGSGRRMSTGRGESGPGEIRKQYLELGGEPILLRALRPFLDHPAVCSVVVALPAEDAAAPPSWLSGLDSRLRVVAGGETREDSVRAALEALPEGLDLIAVHDGARPLVTRAVIDRCLAVAADGVGAVAGYPAIDTMKRVDDSGRVVESPDRAMLWHAQTPQVFPRAMLLDAYRSAGGGRSGSGGSAATDDAALVTRSGGTVVMVPGSMRNIKVTRPADLATAEALLAFREEE